MRTFNSMVLAGSILLWAGGTVGAQVKTIQGESLSMTATIEAIEQDSRTVTVRDDKGIYETFQAPPEVKRFAELKVGDRITARYYGNVVIRVKRPGEAVSDADQAKVVPGTGPKPGGTVSAQRTITASVVAVDLDVPSITIKGPNGRTYSRRVADRKALAQVKVGDQLEITWTEAVLITVEPAK